MKILQINCVYKKGSTGKIVEDIHNTLLEKGIESVVCYGRGTKIKEPYIYKTSFEFLGKINNLKSRFTGIQYNGSIISTNRLIRIIKDEKPDIVHLQCINGFFVNIFRLIEFLKNNKIKTVLTLHAEFIHTANCGHAFDCEKWKTGCGDCPDLEGATKSFFIDNTHKSWQKMKMAFDGFDNLVVVSVSPWLESRAKQSPILSNKIHTTVLNGIETEEVFNPREYDYLKKKYNINNEKIIIHVTANFSSEIKGGKYIIQLAKRLKTENIKIIVIGNTDKSLSLPENIIDIGRVENQIELATYYSMADLCILTSKKETFSMPCAESLSCGTPVIGFKAGAPEQISLEEYSEFVEYGNVDELENCVKKWIKKEDLNIKHLISLASQTYSKENMSQRYMEIYNKLIMKE